MEHFYPVVLQAIAADNYKVYAYMNDGSIRLVDVAPLVNKGGVFLPLQDVNLFQSTLTVMNGTVAWDLTGKRDREECIDLDPFSILAMPSVEDVMEAIS